MKQLFYLTLLILFPMISYSQTLVSVTPGSVNAGATLDVTITGSNTHFTDPNGTELYFGFAPGSSTSQDCINSMTVVDDVTLTANISVPGGVSGTFPVQVINSIDGTIPPGQITVIPNAATVTNLTPNTASAGETLDVTITGSNTHFMTNTNTVWFNMGTGTISINSVTAVDNTTLTANVTVAPNSYSGNAEIYVSNSQDGVMNLTNQFYVTGLTPAQIVSINPSVVNAGQTFNLLISAAGSSFTQVANTVEVGFGGTFVVNSVDVYNDTLLLANVTIPLNAYTAPYNISVSNSWNGTIVGPSLIVYGQDPPSSSSMTVSPNSANAGQTLTVTITGTNTTFTQASATSSHVFLSSMLTGEIIQGDFTIVDDATITAIFTIPANHVTEDMDLTVNTTNSGSNTYLTHHQIFHIAGADPLFAFVIPEPESAENACDGTSQIVVSGGTAPYSYTVDGTTTGLAITTGLCEGLHSATVMDANGESVTMSFVIVPPTGIYTTQTYIDSIMNDTIYNNVITQCTIDYDAIDSIYIESVSQLGGNQILVTWHVAYGAGQFMNITDIYNLSNFSGVYSLALELFCPNKSLSSNLIAFDQIYYAPGVMGVDDQDAFSDLVVYPNPFNGTLSIALGQSQETTITLMDLTGKMVLMANSSDQLIHISTDQLASGQYMLVLWGDASVAIRKVVKL